MEHDLNKKDIKAIKERQDGGTNGRDVESSPTKKEYDASPLLVAQSPPLSGIEAMAFVR